EVIESSVADLHYNTSVVLAVGTQLYISAVLNGPVHTYAAYAYGCTFEVDRLDRNDHGAFGANYPDVILIHVGRLLSSRLLTVVGSCGDTPKCLHNPVESTNVVCIGMGSHHIIQRRDTQLLQKWEDFLSTHAIVAAVNE